MAIKQLQLAVILQTNLAFTTLRVTYWNGATIGSTSITMRTLQRRIRIAQTRGNSVHSVAARGAVRAQNSDAVHADGSCLQTQTQTWGFDACAAPE